MKVAEEVVAPTLTVEGTDKSDGTLFVRVTEVLMAADFVRVTVQVVLALEGRVEAAHCREEMAGKLVSKMVADWEEPPRVAVMVADWSAESAPVLAVNVVEAEFAATLTEDGTVNTDGALLESVTAVATAADFESVTVQVVLALGARLAAVHCRPDTVSGAVSDNVTDLEEPFRVAVIVAD